MDTTNTYVGTYIGLDVHKDSIWTWSLNTLSETP